MNWTSTLGGSVTRRGLLVGAAGGVAALAFRSRPSSTEPRAVTGSRTYPATGLLMSPDELAQRLSSDSVPPRVLDASPLVDYRGDHIPGANHVWWQDTMELNALHYGMVLKPDDGQSDQGRRQRLLERWQVREGSPVVVYDRADGSRSARVAWFLGFLSIPAQVLDGGFSGWLALDETLRDVSSRTPDGPIAAARPQQGFYLLSEEIALLVHQPESQIVDIRTESERNQGPMPGLTIPGAVWLPRDALVQRDGLIKPAAELGAVIAHRGVDLTRNVIVIGRTGLDSALPWLALTLMGAAQVTIADGGWQEWDEYPDLPRSPV